LTGFTGSAGTAVVFAEGKSLFVTDSRYDLQAESEVDTEMFDIADTGKPKPLSELIKNRVSQDDDVAVDGSLFTKSMVDGLKKKLNIKVDSTMY